MKLCRFAAFGFGAMIGLLWLELLGREALAKDQAACALRQLARERRDRAWKHL